MIDRHGRMECRHRGTAVYLLRINLHTLAQQYAVVKSPLSLAPDRFENEILRDGRRRHRRRRRRGGRSVTYIIILIKDVRGGCVYSIRARNISVVYRRSETVIGQPYESYYYYY